MASRESVDVARWQALRAGLTWLREAARVLRGAIRARGRGRLQAWVTECPACGARVRLELPWWARGWRGGCACGWRGSPAELRADFVAVLALAASVLGAVTALAVAL